MNKTNLLVVTNGALRRVGEKKFISKHTGHFLEELEAKNFNLGCLQFEMQMNETESLLNYSPKNIKIHSIKTSYILGNFSKLFSYLRMSLYLVQTIIKYDFVYIFYPGNVSSITIIICILLKKNYGLYINGEHALKARFGKYFIKNANFCLTVSELMKTEIIRSNQNTEVIQPMMDFSKQNILLDRGYSNDEVTRCLFVGRIEYRKGIYELVNAIEKLNKDKIDIQFDLVGGGDRFEEINTRMGNESNVKLHGQVNDKSKLLQMYQNADLFIFPSHDEGFPRVLYEAMMARVPIITTIVGGIGGLMKDQYNCLAIKEKNSDSIYNAVIKILKSPELKIDLVNQASKDVSNVFNGKRKKHSLLVKNKIQNLKN